MNLIMGGQVFENVRIPILWGTRAIVQDKKSRMSVIELAEDRPQIEILAGQPAPGVRFRPRVDGIVVLAADDRELYLYNAREGILSSISLGLPECQITADSTRVGSTYVSGSGFSGLGVGIRVTADGILLGGAVPEGLAELVA